ncbi:glutathione-regulated potassium-efflux system protein KefB [Luteimonas cucumeris]|uniref:Glutathione-regulated potassium-efflux system protein KefB n=1 Tax=Luteimonas cucumeris TaxID=985012 RepID=A0A562L1X9_9GAMM|nr:monovalent cation:proton antiporter-2 (CPA2) family protein [Luteimonas cucumeris]TWI01628.1 glutathione-regulated potassium-efflux system protein KefB [Luteimonas cucumeris]
MHGSGLQIALVFLLAAVIAVPLFKRFGLGAVLGYLAAGVVLGPDGVRVIRDAEPVLAASEIGVVMMLFVIGLELSLPRLKVMRKSVFGAGGLQVAVTGIALGAIALLDGLSWQAALVIGLGLAFSSTAVTLQLLAERKTLGSEHGRLAFAILLFQDLAAIPLIAAIPLLGKAASTTPEPIWIATLKAIVAIAVVIIGGRYLLRQLFRVAARIDVPEMLTASALLAVLGAAWVMQLADLSMGLGAFLAGVLLADSEFRHEIESQIEPFKGLLLGLFFMAVGMSIDLDWVAMEPVQILLGVVVLMAIKFAVLFAVGRHPGGIGRVEALRLGSVMALGGEFAFVIFTEADKVDLIDAAMHDRLVAIVGVSMALTPLLMIVVARLIGLNTSPRPQREFDPLPDDGHPQVIIAGFGRFGQIVARLLIAQRIPFVALETDAQHVDFMRRFGNKIYYGDPARPELLRAAGAPHARIFIDAIDDPEANLRTARVVRRLYPDLKVFARAHDRRHAWQLMDLGVEIFRETFASGLEMGREVLVSLGVPREVAEHRTQRFREHDEHLLASQHLIYDDESALLETAKQARTELEQLFEADIEGDAISVASGLDSRRKRSDQAL